MHQISDCWIITNIFCIRWIRPGLHSSELILELTRNLLGQCPSIIGGGIRCHLSVIKYELIRKITAINSVHKILYDSSLLEACKIPPTQRQSEIKNGPCDTPSIKSQLFSSSRFFSSSGFWSLARGSDWWYRDR